MPSCMLLMTRVHVAIPQIRSRPRVIPKHAQSQRADSIFLSNIHVVRCDILACQGRYKDALSAINTAVVIQEGLHEDAGEMGC